MGYNVSQGFGWQWGERRLPAEAARFNLVMVVFVLVGFGVAMVGIDPLQLALYGSAFTALILPVSLFPFLVLMNDRDYLKDQVNPRWLNVGMVAILLLACVVAVVSIPLMVLSGG